MRTTFGRIAALAFIAVLACVPLAAAAEQTAPKAPAVKEDKPHDQQDKMRWCNAKAKEKELKGDERKAFMSSCLKG